MRVPPASARVDVRRILTEVTLPRWHSDRQDSGIELVLEDAAIDHLVAGGFSKELGARELHRVVESDLLPLVAAQPPRFRGRLLISLDQDKLVARAA